MRRTFSDNWYRVADLRLGLRPGVSVRLHHDRGEPWYVLHARAHAGYFRVNPTTYRLISRLSVDVTLDELWRAAVHQAPEETPGQEETFELVVALYRANLVHVEGSVDETKILERFARKHRKPWVARLSELLFLRIPLIDPDRWLSRRRQTFKTLLSPPMAWLAAAVVLWALAEFVQAGGRAWNQAAHILQFNNLLLLYGAVFVSHLLHEFAHAAVCKRFGGEVRTMGVMLLMLTPLPYVDLSSGWTFRDRRQRALVDAAGMLMDLLVGALATIVWAHSPPGAVNELAYNLMFSTAVYTILFNINPLMRFDGYYILSDLLQIPNLHERAKQQFNQWWRSRVLGLPVLDADGASRRLRAGLLAFFLTSNVYRLMVMLGIVLFVADQYFGVGLLVASALALTYFVLPVKQLLAPLRNPLFRFQHKRLLQRAGLAVAGLLVGLLALPLPDSRVLDGVVEARANTRLYTESGGIVRRLAAVHGQWVAVGDVLVELDNPELAAELAGVAAQRVQALVQEAKALTEASVDLEPVRERLRSLAAAQATLQRQRNALVLRAPHAGVWTDADSQHRVGSWVGRGADLGRVIDDRTHVFLGVIRQEAATALVDLLPDGSQVRIEGDRATLHAVARVTLVPHSQSTLPSAALSPVAGGAVPVVTADPSGQHAAEPFFLLRADLPDEPSRSAAASVRHGRAGWIRIRLPPRPLAAQAWRAVEQFFQRRYQL